MATLFELQGHRGARGLKPENTLPGFESAFDLGVTAIETDVHLCSDGVPVLCHDPIVSQRLWWRAPGSTSPDPATGPAVRGLSHDQLRGYRADRNPDPQRFPGQDAGVTPLARLFAQQQGQDPYAPPTLAELFAFAEAYAGDLGLAAGKTLVQRQRVRRVQFDLELKRVPFRPEFIGDDFNGAAPALLEQRVVAEVEAAGVAGRTTVRSFDHRSVRALRLLRPQLRGAVLVAGAAPMAPPQLARLADACLYCPDVFYLDELQVRQAHAEDVRVIPWTVNDAASWARLLDWGVDGITTDFPDQLAEFLQRRGIAF